MKKAQKKLTLQRETLRGMEKRPALEKVAAGLCSRLGTSCGSCVKACTFTCSIIAC